TQAPTFTPTAAVTPTWTPTPSPSTDLVIYRDALAAPWSDVSWSTTANFANTSPTFGGTRSIRVDEADWGAFSIYSAESVDPAGYQAIDFQIFTASSGFELSVRLENDTAHPFPEFVVGTVPANQWTHVTIPLKQLDPSRKRFDQIDIRDSTGTSRT